MSADFQISLPPWPLARVLKEACASWSAKHLGDPADPDQSPWPLLYSAVLTFLRHEHTLYDAALAAGAERDQLRKQISTAAARVYPWLRIERDPRTNAEAAPDRKHFRVYNDLSKRISNLVSDRARLYMAIKDVRRKKASGWREHVVELEERLARVNARVDELTNLFKPMVLDNDREVHSVVMVHRVPGYDFGGRGELPESYTKSAGFKCPDCNKTVMRTKVPMQVGAGKRQTAFSCYCKSALIDPPFSGGVRSESWQAINKDAPEDYATNIVVENDHGIMYGHQLLKDIAEGRKEAQSVKFFRGVRWAAFYAMLVVRFGDEPCVKALIDLEEDAEITPEHMERISAELVLTAGDIQMVLDSQDRLDLGEI